MKLQFIYLSLIVCSAIRAQAFEVHGHRGCRGVRPENTLPAFAAATEAGVHVLELDLQTTSDGVFVIHHDYFVNGKLIRDLSLSEIKMIDRGSQFDPKFPRQILAPAQIPTLQELFDLVRDKTVRLNLEIKRDPVTPSLTKSARELAQTLVNLVCEQGFSDRVYYSSFDPEVLTEVRKEDCSARIIFIIGNESLSVARQLAPQNPMQLILNTASSFKAEALAPYHPLLDDQTFLLFKNAGFRIIPWTVNDQAEARALIEMGVDGLISDYPQDLYFNNQSFLECRRGKGQADQNHAT